MFGRRVLGRVMPSRPLVQILARPNVESLRLLGPKHVGVKHRDIGVTGFEPATSWSQTTRSTKLSYTPA